MSIVNNYHKIEVESFIPTDLRGKHGHIHIRPTHDQGEFKKLMLVECSKKLSKEYPLGTKFRIKAKVTSREGGTPFIYSNYRWEFEVI